jgi:flagellar basal-body rod protein FlgF
MSKGIYIAVSGATARHQQLDILANNIAHANTPGFKRDAVSFESVLSETRGQTAVDQDMGFVQAQEERTILQAGSMVRTGAPLDVAIVGDAFLRVESPRGERLTRNGRLKMGHDGSLQTLSGLPVLDEHGARIFIPPERIPKIDETGWIRAGEYEVGRLGLTTVDQHGTLTKDVDGLFLPPDDARPPEINGEVAVMQGYIEESNVSPIKQMVELIEVQRHYSMLNTVIRTYKRVGQRVIRIGKNF